MTYLLISIIILIFDQATKFVIVRTISIHEVVNVLPFFQLVNVRNEGAAFGLFQSLGNTFFIVISIGAISVISYLMLKAKDERLALSLILGGAIGNFVDRVRIGYVIDFIDLYVGRYHWPAFNVADSALTVGIAFLFLRAFFRR
jgi:signal peptidase II